MSLFSTNTAISETRPIEIMTTAGELTQPWWPSGRQNGRRCVVII